MCTCARPCAPSGGLCQPPKASDRLKTARVDDDKAFAQAKQAAAQDKVLARVAASEDAKTVIIQEKTPA